MSERKLYWGAKDSEAAEAADEESDPKERRLGELYACMDAVESFLDVLLEIAEITEKIPYGDEPECFQSIRDLALDGIDLALQREQELRK